MARHAPHTPPDPLQREAAPISGESLFAPGADTVDDAELQRRDCSRSASSPRHRGEGGASPGGGSLSKSARHARTLEGQVARAGAERGPSSPGLRSARDIMLDDLKRTLWAYLRRRGRGARLQSVDYLNWLDAEGLRPPGLDMRCLGGLWASLISRGVLVVIGHAPNGGGTGAAKNYGSTTRPVYRVRSIDPKRIDWFSEAEEQKGAA